MTILMNWPQITYIVLVILSIGIVGANHGNRRPEYNIWHYLINMGLSLTLLSFGGFFG